MNSPLFSVIIPVYNVELYLDKCIKSVLEQSFRDFELILVNDGSLDGSLSICNKYKAQDNRVVVIDQANSGVSSARNNGIDSSQGKYINFIDSDDFIEKQYLLHFHEQLSGTDYDLLVSGVVMVFEEDIKKNKVFNASEHKSTTKLDEIGKIISELEISSLLNGPVSKCFKRDIIIKHNILFDSNFHFGEDAIFNHTYLSKIKSISVNPFAEYNYVQRASDSLTKRKYSFERTIAYIDHITKLRLLNAERFKITAPSFFELIKRQQTFHRISAIRSMYFPQYKISRKIRYERIKKEHINIDIALLPMTAIHYRILYLIFSLQNVLMLDFFLNIYEKTRQAIGLR